MRISIYMNLYCHVVRDILTLIAQPLVDGLVLGSVVTFQQINKAKK